MAKSPIGDYLMSVRNKRVSLGVLDQVLSSSSNTLAVFAVASASTVREFGSISLAMAAVMAMVALCRGLLGTLIALLAGQPKMLAVETNHALVLAGSLGVVTGVAIVALAQFDSNPFAVMMVGIAAPAILMQDTARFAVIAAGKPLFAILSDGFWATGSVLLFVLVAFDTTWASPAVVVGGWAGCAAVAALIILALSHFHPVVRSIGSWIRETAVERLRYGSSAAIGSLNGILFLFVVAALLGTPAIAALRGSASVMGPLSILFASMTLVVVPELRRVRRFSSSEYWRPMRKPALAMCVIPVAVGVLSVWVPDAWGEALLGPTWFVAKPLLPITAIEYVALVWIYSADTILRSMERSHAVLALQVVRALMITASATIAAIVFGSAIAVASGLAAGGVLAATYGIKRTMDGPNTTQAGQQTHR